ncbi:Hsp20/alpha crystallin family protein [Brachyspira pilosicoli]|uniref:Hsp20/alpha crystallin family protein n=1 Tax=Brachyspira pilosicoli TaxID=52584 RepID=UPI001C66AE33|nr:Hsp20/alpha crystallin family protein [Brachyspira pilosicoli]MBW5397109.1 Hsp20/alpha crystallin family protein [Brachyspira pilosicoli]
MSRMFFPMFNNRCHRGDSCMRDYSLYQRNYKIYEDDKGYTIEMDMPGVKKSDLEIGVKENILSIYAERKKVIKSEEGDKEEVVSKYEQSFNISDKSIDVDNIAANFENGVLILTLPKKEEVKYEKRIEIA